LTIFQKAFKKKALKTVLDHDKVKAKFSLKRIDPLLQNVHMGFFLIARETQVLISSTHLH
jgi:hypothetical protein